MLQMLYSLCEHNKNYIHFVNITRVMFACEPDKGYIHFVNITGIITDFGENGKIKKR